MDKIIRLGEKKLFYADSFHFIEGLEQYDEVILPYDVILSICLYLGKNAMSLSKNIREDYIKIVGLNVMSDKLYRACLKYKNIKEVSITFYLDPLDPLILCLTDLERVNILVDTELEESDSVSDFWNETVLRKIFTDTDVDIEFVILKRKEYIKTLSRFIYIKNKMNEYIPMEYQDRVTFYCTDEKIRVGYNDILDFGDFVRWEITGILAKNHTHIFYKNLSYYYTDIENNLDKHIYVLVFDNIIDVEYINKIMVPLFREKNIELELVIKGKIFHGPEYYPIY